MAALWVRACDYRQQLREHEHKCSRSHDHHCISQLYLFVLVFFYSVPFEVVHLLEELFSHPWYGLYSREKSCWVQDLALEQKKIWEHGDTKWSDLWKRGDCSLISQGCENSSSNKCTTSKGTLYLLVFIIKKIFCIYKTTTSSIVPHHEHKRPR